jgi:hypothetical protein
MQHALQFSLHCINQYLLSRYKTNFISIKYNPFFTKNPPPLLSVKPYQRFAKITFLYKIIGIN